MDLSKIVSISGKAGLSKVITQTKTNLIVESLIDGKKFPAFATYKISTLEDISVYTQADDVPLKEIFKKIFEKEKGASSSINPKASKDELTGYFKEILPEYDEERVYTSDIKKIITWYNLLVDKNVITADALKEEKPKKEKKTEEKPKAKEEQKEKEEKPTTKKTTATKKKTAAK